MTVEEIDIVVNASVEKAVKEFEKLVPSIKKQLTGIKKEFENVNIEDITAKVNITQIKQEMQKAKKEIKEAFNPNDLSGMKINGKHFKIKNISGYSKEILNLKGHLEQARRAESNIGNIKIPSINTKRSISGARTINTENPDTSIWDTLKAKILAVKPVIQSVKQVFKNAFSSEKPNAELELLNIKISEIKAKIYNAKMNLDYKSVLEAEVELEKLNAKKEKIESEGKGSFFRSLLSGITKSKAGLHQMSGVTVKIKNQIKQMGSSFRNGLGHILKYAGALLSLRGIYSVLSNSARSWLSSQNTGAQQLSANIEYMKYAMGSVFAPVIQYVINLVYQLMKAIQSLAYAFTGVNIFAKATASSMKSASGSAKQASKSLSGIHSEINNVSDNKNSGGSGTATPNMDLSKLDNTPNKIIDAIKNGKWESIGVIIGEKLNEAMNNIPWDKIQSTAKSIGTNIAQFLNGFIATTDWKQIGNTFAQGLNTIIYSGYNFVTTFDWKQFGIAIGDAINGFFHNIDWSVAAKTLSDGIKGIFDTISSSLETIDWQQMARDIEEYVQNIDWSGIVSAIFRGIGTALGGLSLFLGTLISDALSGIGQYFDAKIEECGGNIVLGILKGIGDAVIGIGQWIYDNIFKPFIDGFKSVFGIHSPSTVMEEQGNFIIEGLKNGLTGIWEKVAGIFKGFGENVKNKFYEIKDNISETWENVKSKTKEKWEEIKGNVTDTWENIKGKAKEKFDEVKDKVTDTWNNIKNDPNKAGMATAISNTFSNIKEKARGKFDDIKTKITDSWNNIKNDKNLTSMSDTIKNTFSNLSSKSSDWGKDLVSNMASGIKNNISKVTSAVSSVASKIKNYLHFTEPDEGPLSNFHTYMPDMIDLMVKGIKSNTNKIKSEMENLAGAMSYTINTEAVTGIPSTNPTIKPINIQPNNMIETFEDVLSGYGVNNRQPVHVTIQYLGKEIFDDTIDYINSKTRRTGKNTIVMVGD